MNIGKLDLQIKFKDQQLRDGEVSKNNAILIYKTFYLFISTLTILIVNVLINRTLIILLCSIVFTLPEALHFLKRFLS